MPWRGKARAREIEGDGKLAEAGQKGGVKERVFATHRRRNRNGGRKRWVKQEVRQMRRR